MRLKIRKGEIDEVVALSKAIKEFVDPHEAQEYTRRLSPVANLILIAEYDGQPVGFKVGYAREHFFYSWMGGVLKTHRRLGIAKQLADEMERWSLKHGFGFMRFKTRNAHKSMLTFALNNGFYIIGFEEADTIEKHRIWLEKRLI